jgi:hypothetical protein
LYSEREPSALGIQLRRQSYRRPPSYEARRRSFDVTRVSVLLVTQRVATRRWVVCHRHGFAVLGDPHSGRRRQEALHSFPCHTSCTET